MKSAKDEFARHELETRLRPQWASRMAFMQDSVRRLVFADVFDATVNEYDFEAGAYPVSTEDENAGAES